MKTDLTFFTNEPDATLLDRFLRYFDVLVGYFRTSGFFTFYHPLKHLNIDRSRRAGI